jgi:hypothetical protein
MAGRLHLLASPLPSAAVTEIDHVFLFALFFVTSLLAFESTDLTSAQIQPGNVEVTSIADKVSNGEIWVLGSSLV